jgi:hypothetical protein
MRRTPRNLAEAREELVQVQEEFTLLQKRIENVRDCVTDSLVRLFGEERPALAGLQEEAFIERVAAKVVARLGTSPKSQALGETRYVNDVEAAAFLGLSAYTLRTWRSNGRPSSPQVTRIGKRVMYSMQGLEQYMKERTMEGR